ncbi:type II secretion system protein [Sulfurimonas sp. SAG-AH-194-C21]|nr:type II secretion system protein [Sulfurimonas sp. SAG-AH-194-C21]MDF1883062.1 type II secretion system protein [Sulfurimonas sp. SAG-AH-194-C21]
MKKAFSLIELMIVIMIIGVVYTLVISKLQNVGEAKMTPSLSNLKEYLISLNEDKESVRFLCLNDCSSCSVYKDGVKFQEIENFFDENIQTYRYDFLLGAIRVKDSVYFNEEDIQESVCFSFGIDENLVGDQVIVVYKEKAYDYSAYFTKTQVYDYLEEAIDARQKIIQEVMQ